MGILRKIFATPEKTKAEPARVSSDLGRQLQANRDARATAEKESLVRGKHYTEWVPILNEMRSAGSEQEEQYLTLLLEIIDACERSSAPMKEIPAPGYTKRAAVVYRRRKDFASEIEILERYKIACLDNTDSQHAAGDDLLQRLAKAKDLGSK